MRHAPTLPFRLVLAVLAAAPAALSRADIDPDPAHQPGTPLLVSAYFENDSQSLKPNNNTDRHYTSGVLVTLAHRPEWGRRLFDLFDDAGLGESFVRERTAAGYLLGHHIYTPDNISVEAEQPDDRPWAGYLYGGAYWQRFNNIAGRSTVTDHVELNVGIVGPSSQADDIQRWVHRVFDEPTPEGWDNQLRDELVFNINYARRWKATLLGEAGAGELQVVPRAGFKLGTVDRNLNGAVMLRAGWNLPDDFGPGRVGDIAAVPGDLEAAAAGERELGVYGFVTLAGRAVEHNMFLDGNNFRDGPGVRERPLVGEVQAGVAVQWRWVQLTYSQIFSTEEFYGQDGTDAWGSLTLTAQMEF